MRLASTLIANCLLLAALCACSDDALLSPGSTCGAGDEYECEPPENGVGVCDHATDTCVQLLFSNEGEPCGGTYRAFPSGHAIHYVDSASDLLCSLNQGLFCDGAVCAVVNKLGESCSLPSSCEVGTYCDGTCRQRKNDGETCALSDECSGELCLNGVCSSF